MIHVRTYRILNAIFQCILHICSHLCAEQWELKNDRPIVIILAKYDAVNSVMEFGSEGKRLFIGLILYVI